METINTIEEKLLKLMLETGYPLVHLNGQRIFGPPPDWNAAPPPQQSCEVFIGKLPSDIYEDVIVPVFSCIGKIYELRLMLNYSGSNKGFAFVTYANKNDASRAVKELDGFEILPRRRIAVARSVNNCRLWVGNIPRSMTKEEVLVELSKRVTGIVDMDLCKNYANHNLNRGYGFIKFNSHSAAFVALRDLSYSRTKLWGRLLLIDWADPQLYMDEDEMMQVKTLYVKNIDFRTTAETLHCLIENIIETELISVKKRFDYAYVIFYKRSHAMMAMAHLQNKEVEGSIIEIEWARPIQDQLYYAIKRNVRGNAKYNNMQMFCNGLFLYKQHLYKIVSSSENDEGICSICAEELCFDHNEIVNLPSKSKLDIMCKRFMCAPPVFDYQIYLDPVGIESWIGRVTLPYVGEPLLRTPTCIGPIITKRCYSMRHARAKAASTALQHLKALRSKLMKNLPVQSPHKPNFRPGPGFMNTPDCAYSSMYPPQPYQQFYQQVWFQSY